jgi:hypothetical protein
MVVVTLVSVLVVVLLTLVVTRVATVILVSTGMSQESARFQARSALSGAGFTTNESEAVVEHPLRRRVISLLMVFGSAGLVTAIASLALSFGNATGGERLSRLFVLAVGLGLMLALARSHWINRRLTALIGRVLRSRGVDARDYVTLLDLAGDHTVVEMEVQPGDWVADHTLAELKLRDEGVFVLGIRHGDGSYIGVPRGSHRVAPGDTLVLYGDADRLEELDDRRAGAVYARDLTARRRSTSRSGQASRAAAG